MPTDPDLLLDDCPVVTLGLQVPTPIKERLENLRILANRKGTSASLKDIVSALIFHASEDPETLRDQVLEYRASPARNADVKSGELGSVLDFRRRRPGRRPRTAP